MFDITKYVRMELEYPCLLQSTVNGMLVLFSKPGCGVIAGGKDIVGNIGVYSDTWDMDKFIRAEKESALTNTQEVTMLIARTKKTKMDYPCLGESITTGLVVLFSSKGVGTVVIGFGVHAIGDYSTIWKMDTFTPYQGEITLNNKLGESLC